MDLANQVVAQLNTHINNVETRVRKWVKPTSRLVKANNDTTLHANPTMCSIVMVMRNSKAIIVTEHTKSIIGVLVSLLAKCLALQSMLKMFLSHGICNAIVESDSL